MNAAPRISAASGSDSDSNMIVLGIETSCDETAAAVVTHGRHILSSQVYSQIAVHHPYGGVVPELASRKHIEKIVPVVHTALTKAALDFGQLEGIAVTQGPGLVGSLLVGFTFAKAISMAHQLPFVGINHLEGHLHSVRLAEIQPPFPFVALLASGGHTSIYHVKGHLEFELMGQTRDDAAGEAFDKVAKVLGLGYPGGQAISQYAEKGNPERIRFTRPYMDKSKFDFSFSGIKTAVNRYIQTHPTDTPQQVADIAAGFQEAVVDVLSFKILRAAEQTDCDQIALVGGVAANQRLRDVVQALAAEKGFAVHLPELSLCGDNAAMIAAVGYHYLKQGNVSSLDEDVYSRVKR